jgi:tight adherence protein B
LRTKSLLLIILGIIIGTFIGTTLSGSKSIGIAFGFISAIGPHIYVSKKVESQRRKLQKLWPEILDHLISGLTSGLSLTQTIAGLGKRGPVLSRAIFQEFESEIKDGATFQFALSNVKNSFSDPIADQVCEVLEFARSSGSRDSALTLRTLATYIRSDLALRNEIAAKHGWIKNAAILAGLAPWLLLLILSTQHTTVTAYGTPAGIAVLITGVVLTAIAYFWMDRVGKLDLAPRIFSLNPAKPKDEFGVI